MSSVLNRPLTEQEIDEWCYLMEEAESSPPCESDHARGSICSGPATHRVSTQCGTQWNVCTVRAEEIIATIKIGTNVCTGCHSNLTPDWKIWRI